MSRSYDCGLYEARVSNLFYVCLMNFVVDMVTAASAPWPGVLCLFSLSCVSTLGFLPLKAEEGDD